MVISTMSQRVAEDKKGNWNTSFYIRDSKGKLWPHSRHRTTSPFVRDRMMRSLSTNAHVTRHTLVEQTVASTLRSRSPYSESSCIKKHPLVPHHPYLFNFSHATPPSFARIGLKVDHPHKRHGPNEDDQEAKGITGFDRVRDR